MGDPAPADDTLAAAISDVVAALLADARLPSGGHAQSGGLEPALAEGLAPDRVPDFLAGRLRTVVRVDAATACVARHLVEQARHTRRADPAAPPAGEVGAGNGLDAALWEVECEWAARTPSPAQRINARRLGRGYLRLAARLWPADPALTALTRWQRPGPSRPVVLGALAAAAHLDAARTAFACAYDDVQTVAAATLKLAPRDPLEVTGWVVASAPDIAAVVAACADVVDPRGIPGCSAPLLEAQAERHATRKQRLFHA
jgi:urease accessory protein